MRDGMGVLFDYFSAPSDEIAATAINRIGGPGVPSADTPPLPAFDTLETKGIDPVVMLGQLEALLTGREYRDVTLSKAVAVEDDGERVVVALTNSISAALVDADGEQLAAVAVPWSRTEEFWGDVDPENLASWLGELAGLSRRARERSERLYCWICV
jgi:hypothetical protein